MFGVSVSGFGVSFSKKNDLGGFQVEGLGRIVWRVGCEVLVPKF